jgi:phosphoglycolate phosphatase-like HAD superfamily hydrolase
MMEKATKPLSKRIAVVFDFDDTLAPDSYHSLLESCGLDYATFKQERVQPLVDAGWDEILAKLYCLIRDSQQRDDVKITRAHLAKLGRDIKFFDGVPEMFARVRNSACDVIPDVEVEFYLLSSGILEIAAATPIADQFTAMWGCQFHYSDDGEISFVKQIISHFEKVRYLLQLSKGMNESGKQAQPQDVYQDVATEQLHVPLNQIIYVGDGSSDMPVFDFLNERQGMALAVFKAQTAAGWSGHRSMHKGQRVQNLAPVDYREDSELMQSLTLATQSICKQIALRELSVGE